MTREEAIKIVKEFINGTCLHLVDQEALEILIPELRESEDEKIRKWLVDYFGSIKEVVWIHRDITCEQILNYLEKMKDASKATEAVDRIDKYIDEHLANAHDMKDSNPDKKYYRGWDDALGKMAGILQDVYSIEKKEESLRDFIDDFPYSDQKAQKSIENEDDRIRKELIDFIEWAEDRGMTRHDYHQAKRPAEWIAYLKKQKEQPKEELVYSLNELMQDYIKEGKDDEEKEHRFKCYQLFWDALEDTSYFEQKEQKPAEGDNETEIQKAFREGKSAGRKEVFDHPEEYGLQKEQKPWKVGANAYFTPEQKPAEWSEEDSDNLERIDNYLWMLDDYVGDDCAMPQGKTDKIRGNIQGILSPWLKSLPERFNLQPKQEWSEEDKQILHSFEVICQRLIENPHGEKFEVERSYAEKMLSWLKSISLNLKKKNDDVANLCSNEWSKEDEKMKENLLYLMLENNSQDSWEGTYEWLKSFRPQYHGDVTMTEAYKMGLEAGKASSWKPSEHQMKILKAVKEYVGVGSGYWGEALGSLIEDLEKLM